MISITSQAAWQSALAQFSRVDSYFTWDYHQIEAAKVDAIPILLLHESGTGRVAFPFLIRDVEEVPGARDVTSVYGYAGPLVEGEDLDYCAIQHDIADSLSKHRVVSVFSRLHPLLEQRRVLGGIGQVVEAGQTVAIDLTMSREDQWSQYRANLRREVRALRDSTIVCRQSNSAEDIDKFTRLYNDTMVRRQAARSYLASREYVDSLCSATDFTTHLFLCELDGVMICAGLFLVCGDFVQYHLSGSDPDYRRFAPTKLLLDAVREWAIDRGLRTFHLGGGVGSGEDSLFRFKKGFSKQLHPFATWRWVLDESTYDELCRRRDESRGAVRDQDFFPRYRAR